MGIPDRLLNLAKSYLDSAKSRWEEVDAAAQKELDEAVSSPTASAWERAQAKIKNASAVNFSQKELVATEETMSPQTADGKQPAVNASASVLAAAYQVLDVPPGSSLTTVQDAYQELRQKTDPARFPEGSNDRKAATDIQRRINTAYMILVNSLSSSGEDRFDRLEL